MRQRNIEILKRVMITELVKEVNGRVEGAVGVSRRETKMFVIKAKSDVYNTGGVGEGYAYKEIRLEYTLAILDSLLRGGLEDWIETPAGFEVPAAVRLVDDIYFHPEMLYPRDDFEAKRKGLDTLRHDVIEQIGSGLHPEIRDVFQPA